eukprot:TRINITY_DN1308_c0_g4_i2.p1 TRINITY_DN1308_c0_g4~~TRINITY_DN1308_c0_g4_i2.p1  ORF type:complete len:179 (+),score=12.34 TRINITY_DN1308_c0_g4_i2:203-739(+)
MGRFQVLLLLLLGTNCAPAFRILNKKFILLMKSSELIYRYTFYNDFWNSAAKYIGKPMSRGLFLNSNLHLTVATVTSPGLMIRNESQLVDVYILDVKVLSLIQEFSLSNICCFKNYSEHQSCHIDQFPKPLLLKQLLSNSSLIPSRHYSFHKPLLINDVSFPQRLRPLKSTRKACTTF